MPSENTPSIEHESTGGIDPAEFASSIFEPSGPSEGSAKAVSSDAHTPPPEGSPSSETPATPPPEWENMPKSWKKEMESVWKASTPEVRRYVHEREKQVAEGIGAYKGSADKWSKVTEPFKDILKEYPDADPAEILSALASNHLRMVKSTPEERRQHLNALAKGYGVEFEAAKAAEAAGTAPGQSLDGFTPKQLELLEQRFSPILQAARQSSEFVNRQMMEASTKEVDRFFSDPKNEFVNEVANDILDLIKKGQTQSLDEAYELAVLRNPEVKARYLASLASKVAPAPSTASKLPNVKSSATPKNPAKKATMDDTFAEVLAKHYPST